MRVAGEVRRPNSSTNNMKTIKTVAIQTGLSGLVLGWASLQAAAAVVRVPAQYATIQAAVNEATSGDEIRIAAGTYTEQVLITSKNLKLVGEPGAVLKAFPGMPVVAWPKVDSATLPLLGIIFCDHVLVRGLTLDGGRLADICPGLGGAIFHGSGGAVERCTIRGFRGESGFTFALGLFAGNSATFDRPLQRVSVLNNTFEDNANSIYIQGTVNSEPNPEQLHLEFNIEGNVIRGYGPTDSADQTGIHVQPGAGGEVKHNLITGHNYTGPDLLFSFGIEANGFGVALLPIRYVENVFQDNQIHLASFFATGAQFVENSFEGPGTGPFNIGIVSSGSADRIIANRFRNLTSGVFLVGDDPIFGTTLGIASDASLIANRFCEVGTPIILEPLVTGVQERGTRLNDCRGEDEADGGPDSD
jgi:hypothetical protein